MRRQEAELHDDERVRRWRRRPRSRLEDVGSEPDPRFTLANERTFLAWTRTALGLLAAGLAVSEFLRTRPEAQRLAIGIPLIALAAVVAYLSYGRWERTERAMRLGRPLPNSGISRLVSLGIVLVSVTAALILLGTRQ